MIDDKFGESPTSSRSGRSVIDLLISVLPIMIAVAGGIWAVYQYFDHAAGTRAVAQAQSQRDARTRLLEAQRPFLQKQLDLFFETSAVVGRLVTLDDTSAEWDAAAKRFWALYWSELSLVEKKNGSVESAMVHFGKGLEAHQGARSPATRRVLEGQAYDLAHALRSEIEASWNIDPAPDPR